MVELAIAGIETLFEVRVLLGKITKSIAGGCATNL